MNVLPCGVHADVQDLADEGFARREVVVEAARLDASAFGDIGEAGVGVPAIAEQFSCRNEDPLPGTRRF